MAKGKDFYGKDIAEVIEQACRELGAGHEDLDIEVLETGSSGIFGLCKKKAHIRVKRKMTPPEPAPAAETAPAAPVEAEARGPEKVVPVPVEERPSRRRPVENAEQGADETDPASDEAVANVAPPVAEEPEEPPSAEALDLIQADLSRLLDLMGLGSEVQVVFADNTVQCTITGPHEEQIVGPEGRTLDSLQYLLRKMIGAHLPERATLSLDAAGYREQRLARLQEQATELAAQVRQNGKTKVISGLNPAERRAVHLALQQDGEIRSRSVGSGLFKKILIYKTGKESKPATSKRRSGAGERQDKD